MPRLNGRRITGAPAASATSAVASGEPSETTTTRRPGANARSSASTRPMFRPPFKGGPSATRLRAPSPAPAAAGAASVSVDMRSRPQSDELEQLPRAVAVRVLVQHPLARTPAHLLRLRRIVEQVA